MKTNLSFSLQLPPLTPLRAHSVLIYDRRLSRSVPGFASWSKLFPRRYAVTAGESLKDISAFPRHIQNLLRLTSDIPRSRCTVIAVGGGSLLDFAGFIASTLRRGVRLVSLPSTWLAAIDAAHGGKTALNVAGVKNQIGTFYPASKIYLIRSLLMSQPEVRAREAVSELVKIALIDGSSWTRRLANVQQVDGSVLWKFLRPAIEAKMRVVSNDPFEKNGKRAALNLGHTLGHVYEAALGWPHGIAVAEGLRVMSAWSAQRYRWGVAIQRRVGQMMRLLPKVDFKVLSKQRMRHLLLRDKKISSNGMIRMIFIRDVGDVVQGNCRVDQVMRAVRINRSL